VTFYAFRRKKTIVYLVDTPGFDDSDKSDVEVLQELAHWLKTAYEESVILDGIIYLHRITDVRMQGSAAKNLRMFKYLCGDDALRKVILATTRWEEVPETVGAQRETELKNTDEYWGSMVKHQSRVERHYNKRSSALRLIDSYLPALPANKRDRVFLEIQNEMMTENKQLPETKAGKSLDDELTNNRDKLGKELTDVREMLRTSTMAQDEVSAQELVKHMNRIDSKIRRLENQKQALAKGIEEYSKSSALKKLMKGIQMSALQRRKDETDRKLQELEKEKTKHVLQLLRQDRQKRREAKARK